MKTDNEIIAYFMEQHVTPVGLRRNVMEKSYYVDELKYDTSWEWLMPVAKKCIESYHDMRQDIFNALDDCDMKALHKACVEFIHWHNININLINEYLEQKSK